MKGGAGEFVQEINVITKSAPPDRMHIVYISFFLGGMGSLLPWNVFINSIPYFEFKLGGDARLNNDSSTNISRTTEQELFGNYLSLCTMLPLTVSTILNLIIMKWFSSKVRFLGGSAIVFVMFLSTVILVYIKLSPEAFLALTLASVVVINIGGATLQSAIFGIGALLPARNMKAILEGQALAGILAALGSIISIASTSEPTHSAFAYFICSLVFLVIAMGMIIVLQRTAYYKYYSSLGSAPAPDNTQDDALSKKASMNTDHVEIHESSSITQSMREVWLHGLSTLFTFMASLTVFPVPLYAVKPMNYMENDPWTGKFFIPVVVFLQFNVGDWVGRALAGMIKWPRRDQKWNLLVICTIRFAIVPFAFFINSFKDRSIPVLFYHDAFVIIYVAVLSLSNGYLVTLAMMYGPSFASRKNAETAGAALTIYLSFGLASGVALSAILALIH